MYGFFGSGTRDAIYRVPGRPVDCGNGRLKVNQTPNELRLKILPGGWVRILAVWGLDDVSQHETQDWKATLKARDWYSVPRIWE